RELEREAAGVEHAVAHVLGDRAEMRIAGRELRPRVADADDRPPLELVLREAAVLEPRAVVEPHLVLAREPGFAAHLPLRVIPPTGRRTRRARGVPCARAATRRPTAATPAA